jgi:hypothetical protein
MARFRSKRVRSHSAIHLRRWVKPRTRLIAR